MKWWSRRRTKGEDTVELEQARTMREHAEKALREARLAAREIRTVAIEARRLRTENQFSRRLSEAFESRPHNHG
jgi:hypothetical protein